MLNDVKSNRPVAQIGWLLLSWGDNPLLPGDKVFVFIGLQVGGGCKFVQTNDLRLN